MGRWRQSRGFARFAARPAGFCNQGEAGGFRRSRRRGDRDEAARLAAAGFVRRMFSRLGRTPGRCLALTQRGDAGNARISRAKKTLDQERVERQDRERQSQALDRSHHFVLPASVTGTLSLLTRGKHALDRKSPQLSEARPKPALGNSRSDPSGNHRAGQFPSNWGGKIGAVSARDPRGSRGRADLRRASRRRAYGCAVDRD